MHMHASCAARDGDGVLLLGPSGAGKSDLLLRLLQCGFDLVADDRVEFQDGEARPPERLAGLLEVRGFGVVRLHHVAPVRVALAVRLEPPGAGLALAERVPWPRTDPALGVPVITLDGAAASAPYRVALALDCALGRVAQVAGAFAQ